MEESNAKDLTMMKKIVQVCTKANFFQQQIIALFPYLSGWRMESMEICWILQHEWQAKQNQGLYRPNTIEWWKAMSRI